MNDAACGDADVDFCASQAVAAPDIFQCSQPAAPAATPVARFVPVADAADAADAAGAVAPFELCCSAGAQLQLGRVVPESALPIGVTVIFLTPRHDIGISRNQGVLRFDGKSIVLEPIKRERFPTFLNGVLVDTPQSLAHSDVLGFGNRWWHALCRYGALACRPRGPWRAFAHGTAASQRPKPPPPSGSEETAPVGVDAAAPVGEKRGRGERGGRGRKKQARVDGADIIEPTAATTSVSAEDVVKQERAAIISELSGELKRYALRALEQIGIARARLLETIEEASGGDVVEGLDALART